MLITGTVPVVETIEGVLQTPDGYWRVEVVRSGRPATRWYRIWHANTVVLDQAAVATVQHVLGDAYATLEPVPGSTGAGDEVA
jgi:hypothetical protein